MVLRKGITSVTTRSTTRKVLEERLFIGTLGVNCLEYTRRTIDTVDTSCKDVKFVYIDNGSTDENVELLKKWNKRNDSITEFAMGFNGWNAGVAVGWNQLIKMALEWKATKILICNNDIAFGPRTINGMVGAYNRLRESVPETVMVTAANKTKNPNQLAEIAQEWKYEEHPDFSCFMITPETIERVGMFSEDYKPAFFEDNDMHWRILLMGYKAFGTDWAPYSHIASRTRYGNPNIVSHKTFRQNKMTFFQNMLTREVTQEIADERYAKWLQAHPDQPHPDHKDVLAYAEEQGLITDDLKTWLDGLTVENMPR